MLFQSELAMFAVCGTNTAGMVLAFLVGKMQQKKRTLLAFLLAFGAFACLCAGLVLTVALTINL